jgi:Lysine-specific metallo-endopeptidase
MSSQLDRSRTLFRMIDELAREVGAIRAALAPGPAHNAGVVAARNLYLTSGDANRAPRVDVNLEKIRKHFTAESDDKWHWNVSDVEWGLLRQGQLKLFCTFGWTDYTAKVIKISPKAFRLNPLLLKGTMLHEVTHAQFSTQDIAYDYGVFPSSSHAKLARLDPKDKMDNADSWRIFYQEAVRAMA